MCPRGLTHGVVHFTTYPGYSVTVIQHLCGQDKCVLEEDALFVCVHGRHTGSSSGHWLLELADPVPVVTGAVVDSSCAVKTDLGGTVRSAPRIRLKSNTACPLVALSSIS